MKVFRIVKPKCCKVPDKQTFGPNEIISKATVVCMNCGRIHKK